jgi:cytoskeleton protein RodZ
VGLLGERLRREREKQGMTLDEVFSSTRINTRMLRAIEEEKFDQLPGGIFNKGFVRAYARHLNLDEQQAVDDYLSIAGLVVAPVATATAVEEPPVVAKVEIKPAVAPVRELPAPKQDIGKGKHAKAQASKPKLAEPPPQKEKRVEVKAQAPKAAKQRPAKVDQVPPRPSVSPVERIPWGRLAFALLLIAFGVAIWGSFEREPEEQHISRPVESPVAKPVSSADPKVSQTPSATPPDVTIPSATAPADTGQIASSVASVQEVPAAATPTPAAESGSFMLVVQAREDSWLVVTADGKEVVKQVLGAAAEKTIAARKEIIVKVGNAGGVDFLFNGKKLPSQGDHDEVKRLTFDPNGLETPVSKAPTTLASRPAA